MKPRTRSLPWATTATSWRRCAAHWLLLRGADEGHLARPSDCVCAWQHEGRVSACACAMLSVRACPGRGAGPLPLACNSTPPHPPTPWCSRSRSRQQCSQGRSPATSLAAILPAPEAPLAADSRLWDARLPLCCHACPSADRCSAHPCFSPPTWQCTLCIASIRNFHFTPTHCLRTRRPVPTIPAGRYVPLARPACLPSAACRLSFQHALQLLSATCCTVCVQQHRPASCH